VTGDVDRPPRAPSSFARQPMIVDTSAACLRAASAWGTSPAVIAKEIPLHVWPRRPVTQRSTSSDAPLDEESHPALFISP
jgi:hypothetical protein